MCRAVGQLTRQGAAFQQAWPAAYQITRFTRGLARAFTGHALLNNPACFARVQFKKFSEGIRNRLRYRPLHFRIEQFNLRLALKLRVRMLNADNRRQPFQRIIAGEVGFLLLQQVGFARIAVNDAGDGGAQPGQVRTAVRRVNGVGEGQFGLDRRVRVLESHFHTDVVGAALFGRKFDLTVCINRLVQRPAVMVQVQHERAQAAFKVERGLCRDRLYALIAQCDRDLARHKRHLAEALCQNAVAELVCIHHGEVWHESNARTCRFARLQRAHFTHLSGWLARVIRLLPQMSITENLGVQFGRERVHR